MSFTFCQPKGKPKNAAGSAAGGMTASRLSPTAALKCRERSYIHHVWLVMAGASVVSNWLESVV